MTRKFNCIAAGELEIALCEPDTCGREATKRGLVLSIVEIDGMIFPIAAFGRSERVEGGSDSVGNREKIFYLDSP
jgi:hypothetical protein